MFKYLDLLREVLDHGEEHDDRTGVGALSLFDREIRHDMREGFPLLTTKKVPLKSTFEELRWFLSGSTNVNDLPEFVQKWWRPWAGEEGSLGPIYGAQLRGTGTTEFFSPDGVRTSLPGYEGVDQIASLLNDLEHQPNSRRLITTTWQPERLAEMRLPPCHGLVTQFKVHRDGDLSLKMYQRSADIFIGVPVNIASYALLLKMIAKVTGRKPRQVGITFGDLHLYKNHVEQAKEQLTRTPYPLPNVYFDQGVPEDGTPLENLLAIRWEHLWLSGYQHHPAIKAPVAV